MRNTSKIMIKIKNRHIFKRWAMPQNILVNNFEQIKDTFQFNKNFIKNYNEESDKGYFFEVNVQCLEKLHELHNDLPFLPKQ